jgi:hypothetical protein
MYYSFKAQYSILNGKKSNEGAYSEWIDFGDNIIWQDKLIRYQETDQELYLHKYHVEQALFPLSTRQK